MVGKDNTNAMEEWEESASPLPPLYAKWMSQALKGPLPREAQATCANCAMCQTAPNAEKPALASFNPETKCCTWLPLLPNFLVGRVLADDTPEMQEGRISVEKRLQKGAAVTPLGMGHDAIYDFLYHQGQEVFGQSRALRCPHYIEEGGRCGIWRHRESTCATWFCKYERGMFSHRFWQVMHDLLRTVEAGLAAWCLSHIDVGTEALRLLFPQAGRQGRKESVHNHLLDNGSADPGLYRALWGRWFGREADFFRECASLVNALSWDEVCTICGSTAHIYTRLTQEAYAALQSKTIPPLLRVRPYQTTNGEPGYSRVHTSAGQFHMRIPNVLRDVLPSFDGRPFEVVQQAIKAEKKLALSEGLIRKLVDYDILRPVTDATE